MNQQTHFPLFDLPDNALLKIFSELSDDEYITMLNLYENRIPQIISKIRLNRIFGDDLVIEEKISNRGWHYITKNLLSYSTDQSFIPNSRDNRYFTVENNLYIPTTTEEMKQVTHLAKHSFGRHKKLTLVKNYEEKRVVVQSHINYFEVTFENVEAEMTYIFGIGLCKTSYDKTKMVGWEKFSIGYHSDDGKMFYESGSGKKYGETYGKGDTIGCGFDSVKNVVFFTKNGKRIDDIQVEEKEWYPAISMKKFKPFTVNFGEEPFKYDVYGFKPRDEQMELIEELEGQVKKEQDEVSKLLDILNGMLRDLGASSISESSDDEDEEDEKETSESDGSEIYFSLGDSDSDSD